MAVYRLFNVTGALLYVGISGNPKVRFGQHAADKAWWPQVADWTVAWFAGRPAALAEEGARDRRRGAPAYNLAGVPVEEPRTDRRAGWCAIFDQFRPSREDLDDLFLVMVKTDSLTGSVPRRTWQPGEARDVYIHARRRARWWSRQGHDRFVDRWNDRQVVAWYAHFDGQR